MSFFTSWINERTVIYAFVNAQTRVFDRFISWSSLRVWGFSESRSSRGKDWSHFLSKSRGSLRKRLNLQSPSSFMETIYQHRDVWWVLEVKGHISCNILDAVLKLLLHPSQVHWQNMLHVFSDNSGHHIYNLQWILCIIKSDMRAFEVYSVLSMSSQTMYSGGSTEQEINKDVVIEPK